MQSYNFWGIAARARLSITDKSANAELLAKFGRQVDAMKLLLESPAKPKPATPTPSLETAAPFRFLVFPEGLVDRKYAALVVIPARVGSEAVLRLLLSEATRTLGA